jgi:hypothetical protein
MMAAIRKMERFLFWMNLNNDEDRTVAEMIHSLKKERSFARTIRQGIRLIVSLRQRDTSVLFELFPWLKDELSIGELPANQRRDDSLRIQLKRLEELIVQQGGMATERGSTVRLEAVGTGNPKPLRGTEKVSSVPVDVDMDIEIKVDEDAGARSSENLLRSLWALQNGTGAWSAK